MSACQTGVPTLVELCYARVLEGQLAVSELAGLPQDLLVELAARLQRDCKAAVQQRTELLRQVQRRYLIKDLPCRQDAVTKEAWQHREHVVAKWTADAVPGSDWKPITGVAWQPKQYFRWEVDTGRYVLVEDLRYSDKPRGLSEDEQMRLFHAYYDDQARQSKIMSSALLLYRLCCLFPEGLQTAHRVDGYKAVWGIRITHKATGMSDILGEHKGAAAVFLLPLPEIQNDGSIPEEVTQDLLELLNLLYSPEFLHAQ